jgi:hypothetical protein
MSFRRFYNVYLAQIPGVSLGWIARFPGLVVLDDTLVAYTV